jgi:hypothetical protein
MFPTCAIDNGRTREHPSSVAHRNVKRCGADPGSIRACGTVDPGSAAHHFVLRRVRGTTVTCADTTPRPGSASRGTRARRKILTLSCPGRTASRMFPTCALIIAELGNTRVRQRETLRCRPGIHPCMWHHGPRICGALLRTAPRPGNDGSLCAHTARQSLPSCGLIIAQQA